MKKPKSIDAQITNIEKEVSQAEEKTHDYLLQLPNMLHETVPVGKDDTDNIQVKTWGTLPKYDFSD